MAFSYSTVSHKFSNANNTAASGAVEFTLTMRMSQTGTTIMPGSITCTLDGTGAFSQSLASTQDASTVPQDAQWRVDIRILGAEMETFFITIPSGGADYDLMALLPQDPVGG